MPFTTCSQTSSVACQIQREAWAPRTSTPSWSESGSFTIHLMSSFLLLSRLCRLWTNVTRLRRFKGKHWSLLVWERCWDAVLFVYFQTVVLLHNQRKADRVSSGETVSALQDCQVSTSTLPYSHFHLWPSSSFFFPFIVYQLISNVCQQYLIYERCRGGRVDNYWVFSLCKEIDNYSELRAEPTYHLNSDTLFAHFVMETIFSCKEHILNSWSGQASVCLWLILHPYSELKGRAFYITQWQSEFRYKCFLDNEIWSKRQGKDMFMTNEPIKLFLLRILNFCIFHLYSYSVQLLIPMTLILPLCTGRSVSGVTWPSLCLCSPCVSVVLRGCRSVGSAIATSWLNPEFTSLCSPSLPSCDVGPNPSLRYHI